MQPTEQLKKLYAVLNKNLSNEDLVRIIEESLIVMIKTQQENSSLMEKSKVELDKNLEIINHLLDAIKLKKGDKGDKGIRGEMGETYNLTDKDKKEIAGKIKVPIVKEKIIEKTEIIKEQPIITEKITNEIKEVAKYEEPEQIRNKLELLKDDERLDRSAIKGLENLLEERIKKIPRTIMRGGGGGAANAWAHETFNVNSSTTTITLANPIGAGTLAIFADYNGQMIWRGTHYTVDTSGTILTLTFTPEDNTKIHVAYMLNIRTL